ncbi:MAG: thioesterase superfamily protein [Firmicutes bacterium]|nr:thioesterase superfamily protein [Bacillota bacterium]
MEEALIRIRMSEHDAHYAGGLVNGSRMLDLFGDVATELLIRLDGDEGLFVAYDNVEFKAPVFAGDFIEARGSIVKTGKTSRRMEFVATKVISLDKNASHESAALVLTEPVVVCKASGTCVVPMEKQRR